MGENFKGRHRGDGRMRPPTRRKLRKIIEMAKNRAEGKGSEMKNEKEKEKEKKRRKS